MVSGAAARAAQPQAICTTAGGHREIARYLKRVLDEVELTSPIRRELLPRESRAIRRAREVRRRISMLQDTEWGISVVQRAA